MRCAPAVDTGSRLASAATRPDTVSASKIVAVLGGRTTKAERHHFRDEQLPFIPVVPGGR